MRLQLFAQSASKPVHVEPGWQSQVHKGGFRCTFNCVLWFH